MIKDPSKCSCSCDLIRIHDNTTAAPSVVEDKLKALRRSGNHGDFKAKRDRQLQCVSSQPGADEGEAGDVASGEVFFSFPGKRIATVLSCLLSSFL